MQNKSTKIGRPPKFDSPEQMQELIDAYFTACKGHPIEDENGEVVYNKNGEPIIPDAEPPTITGLALALGFSTRQSLLNYQAKREFVDTILIAKSRVEKYAEIRLYDRDGVSGAKFNLSNNFSGWSDRQTTELFGKDGGTIKMEQAVQIYIPDNGREVTQKNDGEATTTTRGIHEK